MLELVALLEKEQLHLLLLDIGLSGMDGLQICKLFRKKTEVPVIMITSKNNELTELVAIHEGADDFVAKPFNPQLLIAHMESVMRRVYRDTEAMEVIHVIQKLTNADGTEREQEFTLELLKGRISNKMGIVELSKNELQILKLLVERRGEIVSRDEIMNSLWDNCMFVDDNTLTVNMTRLKGKLDEIQVSNAIVTKRGMGYQLL